MAMAAAYLAFTLAELGHQVRGYTGGGATPAWKHPRIEWRERSPLFGPSSFDADLIISTIQPQWRRLALDATKAGAIDRTVFWHHHGSVPQGLGGMLAGLNRPAVFGAQGWRSVLLLPPSSWAAEVVNRVVGDAILVPGAGAAKGGYIAREVAKLCPELRWYVLPGRHAAHDLQPWQALRNAEVAPGLVTPATFLARARAVLSPTREEIHPLTLVEAAVRGIPIVCTDLPATRAALLDGASYVPLGAPPLAWAMALQGALRHQLEPLSLRPYAEVVAGALEQLAGARRAA
jgi:glycosyltransferase involved in cell wall biosynthesis